MQINTDTNFTKLICACYLNRYRPQQVIVEPFGDSACNQLGSDVGRVKQTCTKTKIRFDHSRKYDLDNGTTVKAAEGEL